MSSSGREDCCWLPGLGRMANMYKTPDLVGVVTWLEASRPPTTEDVLCHGDRHPLNLFDRW